MMRQGALSPSISVPDTIGELLLMAGASVPFGQSGKVHVVGRNDMPIPMTMGITWVVKDPDGVVLEEHTDDWAGLIWPTDVNPDDTHEFISFLTEGFDFNKSGTWTISIALLMNYADPVTVDTYDGVLCVVEPIEGTIIRKELEYSGSGDGVVPVIGVPLGVRAKLHVWGRNDTSVPQGMGIYWFVADPDGLIAEEYTDWGGTIGPYPTDHEFISSRQFDLNKVGKYTTWIELLMGPQDDPQIVARYIGDLCTVVAPEYEGKIIEMELEYDSVRGTIPVL